MIMISGGRRHRQRRPLHRDRRGRLPCRSRSIRCCFVHGSALASRRSASTTLERERLRGVFARFRAGARGGRGPGADRRRSPPRWRLATRRDGDVHRSQGLHGSFSGVDRTPARHQAAQRVLQRDESTPSLSTGRHSRERTSGDGILAVFGAPIPTEDHADRSLAAAREMLEVRLPRFNRWLREARLGQRLRDGHRAEQRVLHVGERRLAAAARVHRPRGHGEHRVAPRGA